jgi:hypothetical protein
MATAGEVIVDALQSLIIQASESEIDADEAQTAIRYMNDYMASIAAYPRINLGYTVVKNLGDTVTIPAGALRGLKANLAVSLAPQYSVPLTQELLIASSAGQKAMLAISFKMRRTQYPSTLPRGSGNDTRTNGRTSPFYNGIPDNITTEDNSNIDLETNTGG